LPLSYFVEPLPLSAPLLQRKGGNIVIEGAAPLQTTL